MRRRILCITLALLLLASLFVACSTREPYPPIIPQEWSVEETIILQYYETETSPEFRLIYLPEDITLRFRGSFSDTYVMFVDGPFEYAATSTFEYVNGHLFIYPNDQQLVAYHQGSFYHLKEAFELGFLTPNDVSHLYQLYMQLGTDRDEKGEVPTKWAACTHNSDAPSTDPTIESAR